MTPITQTSVAPFLMTWLLVLTLLGCGPGGGAPGGGGAGGAGAAGGAPECETAIDCDGGGECLSVLCTAGMCSVTTAENGASCADGECREGACTPVFPCTEQGILDAIVEGQGPHRFACNGPTRVVTEKEIVINNDVILDGEGELTLDGDADHRVLFVESGITAELRGTLITGGAAMDGAGVFNIGTFALIGSTVIGNSADAGGGIRNSGSLNVTNSTVSANDANDGAGIINFGTFALSNSTVSGNTAIRTGGGIRNHGALTLTNCTVSGNAANDGGGVFNPGTLTLSNSTVAGNVAGNQGDGVRNVGVLTLANALIQGDCSNGGVINSAGHNIESPGDTCGLNDSTDKTDVSTENLRLGPLEDNGGSTLTHALLAGSVAIDAIPNAMCEVATDQRGFVRPQGPACDVGAFEAEQ